MEKEEELLKNIIRWLAAPIAVLMIFGIQLTLEYSSYHVPFGVGMEEETVEKYNWRGEVVETAPLPSENVSHNGTLIVEMELKEAFGLLISIIAAFPLFLLMDVVLKRLGIQSSGLLPKRWENVIKWGSIAFLFVLLMFTFFMFQEAVEEGRSFFDALP